MYVIKVSNMYFTGSGVSCDKRDAKRFDLATPTSTFRDYLTLLFGDDARFVRLTSRADRIAADVRTMYDDPWDI